MLAGSAAALFMSYLNQYWLAGERRSGALGTPLIFRKFARAHSRSSTRITVGVTMRLDELDWINNNSTVENFRYARFPASDGRIILINHYPETDIWHIGAEDHNGKDEIIYWDIDELTCQSLVFHYLGEVTP
jgi:hypothetical protein